MGRRVDLFTSILFGVLALQYWRGAWTPAWWFVGLLLTLMSLKYLADYFEIET